MKGGGVDEGARLEMSPTLTGGWEEGVEARLS